jgi:hypothetical protein
MTENVKTPLQLAREFFSERTNAQPALDAVRELEMREGLFRRWQLETLGPENARRLGIPYFGSERSDLFGSPRAV